MQQQSSQLEPEFLEPEFLEPEFLEPEFLWSAHSVITHTRALA
jgi:hypothetical protein